MVLGLRILINSLSLSSLMLGLRILINSLRGGGEREREFLQDVQHTLCRMCCLSPYSILGNKLWYAHDEVEGLDV